MPGGSSRSGSWDSRIGLRLTGKMGQRGCRVVHINRAQMRKDTDLVRHEGGDGATYLMVVHVGAARTQQQEEKAHRHRHLQHRIQFYGLP